MAETPSVGHGGHVLRGQEGLELRSRLVAALARPGLSRAAAIGNLAAVGCIGLSLMPGATPDLNQAFAGMTEPAQAMLPWLLALVLMTSAIASVMLLVPRLTVAVQLPARPVAKAQVDAGQEFRLSRIGHELRTPLTAIIGFSDMMQCELHGPLGSDRYQCYAGHIRDSGVTLLQAIEVAITTADADPGNSGISEGSRRE